MKEQLGNLYTLLTTVDPELAGYLNKQESSNMFFCFRWLLVWFKREFPFRDIYILWETLWTKKECKNYHLLVCLAILTTERDVIIRNEYGFTEILKVPTLIQIPNTLQSDNVIMKAKVASFNLQWPAMSRLGYDYEQSFPFYRVFKLSMLECELYLRSVTDIYKTVAHKASPCTDTVTGHYLQRRSSSLAYKNTFFPFLWLEFFLSAHQWIIW